MTDRSESRIAVVIPCFNDGATLGDTVESVLQQESCELVVVDDGSTDPETLRVCDELRARGITVLRQENKGLSAARMKGVAATSASYVYPIDSDDMLVPGALTELADALDREPDNVAAAWGRTVTFGDMDMLYRRAITTIDAWRVTHSAGLPYAALFRRDALLAVGGWSLRGGYEDWDLWMALAEHGYDGLSCAGIRPALPRPRAAHVGGRDGPTRAHLCRAEASSSGALCRPLAGLATLARALAGAAAVPAHRRSTVDLESDAPARLHDRR